MMPRIEMRKCPAQVDICPVLKICPKGAVSYVEDPAERLGGRIVIDEARCDGCGVCVPACCGHAISMA